MPEDSLARLIFVHSRKVFFLLSLNCVVHDFLLCSCIFKFIEMYFVCMYSWDIEY